ncbi:MAG TPA: hypothetical protein PLU37_12420 [Chitinophagaceae bacterium]|nr:hypothetical protein [Chitinophagaceae bacterium]
MKYKRIVFTIFILVVIGQVKAQEIQARLTVIASKVSTKIDKKAGIR